MKSERASQPGRAFESLRWVAQDGLRAALRLYGKRRGEWRAYGATVRRLHGWRLTEDRWGNTFLCDLDSYIDAFIYLYGGYESGQIDALVEQAQARGARLFVDVGANVGGYSLAVARHGKVDRVLAFEPDDANRAQLHTNVMLNRLSTPIEVMPIGLSDEEREAILHRPEPKPGALRNAGLSSLEREGSGPGIKIPLKRLDDVCKVRGASVVVKIDVEGHEAAVLRGAMEFLAGNHVWLLLESFAENIDQSRSILARLGYRESSDPRLAADNFIFVRDA